MLYGLRPQMLPTPCVVCMTHILGLFANTGRNPVIFDAFALPDARLLVYTSRKALVQSFESF